MSRWQSWEVRQFFRIRHNVDCVDMLVIAVNREYGEWFSVQIGDHTWIAIDERHTTHEVPGNELADASQDGACNRARSMDEIRQCDSLATPIGIEHGIIRKHGNKLIHFAARGGAEKLFEELTLFLRGYFESRAHFDCMLAGAPENLPAVGLTLPKYGRNLCVLILKDFAKKKYSPFNRCQPFKQNEESHGK